MTTSAYSIEQEEECLTGEEVVEVAEDYLGYRYCWGGTGPYSFDCSGFVQYVFRECGYEIGRTCCAQSSDGEFVINNNDLLPGDIVLFKGTYNTSGYSHSGIYIGEGNFIHAANSRKGVCISSLNDAYYSAKFAGGVRVAKQTEDVVPEDIQEPPSEERILVIKPLRQEFEIIAFEK